MDNILYILGSVGAVSLISFAGVLTLSFREERLARIVFMFVAVATGALLGDAFLHLIPEAYEKIKNPEGIYFSTRDRIFGVLEYLGYDFYDLIPDLDKLFPEIKREEVGNYIYNLLADTVRKKNELYERRAERLRPDDDELLERYAEWAVR